MMVQRVATESTRSQRASYLVRHVVARYGADLVTCTGFTSLVPRNPLLVIITNCHSAFSVVPSMLACLSACLLAYLPAYRLATARSFCVHAYLSYVNEYVYTCAFVHRRCDYC